MIDPSFLTTTQAAVRLKLNVSSVRRLIAEKKLQAVKLGRDWFISEMDILQYIEEHKKHQ